MSKYILALDASQIKTYKDCNLLWAYLYRENLRLTSADTSAMDKGTIMHFLLEHYYKAKAKSPNDSHIKWIQESINIFDEEIKKYPEKAFGFDRDLLNFLKQRFTQYSFNWAGRDFTPISKNGEAAAELGFSKVLYEDDNILFLLEGRIDLMIEYEGDRVCIVDHKTQDRETHLFDYRIQPLTYALAAGVNYTMINYVGLQKELTKTSLRRTVTNIPNWMIERHREWILENVFTPIYRKDFEDNVSDTSKYPNEFKFDRDFSNCAGAFDSHSCIFSKLCFVENQELRENLKRFHYEKVESWSPWKVKEIL